MLILSPFVVRLAVSSHGTDRSVCPTRPLLYSFARGSDDALRKNPKRSDRRDARQRRTAPERPPRNQVRHHTTKKPKRSAPLDETESIQLLQTLVKQRKESIDQFTKGNRQDLVDKETKELAIIETYLPAGASDAEMDAAITKAIAETSATSIKQMGAVVKAAKAALEGKTVDGKALSDRVRSRLS